MGKLLKDEAVCLNPTSQWWCPPLLVPKPGAKFRFTVYLRPSNKLTIRYQYRMPNIKQKPTQLRFWAVYAVFDFLHGYWQNC